MLRLCIGIGVVHSCSCVYWCSIYYNRQESYQKLLISIKMFTSFHFLKESNMPNNYRPVSLLSCIGKLMERIIFKHMYNFLLVHNLIYKYQSGFQPGHSTVYQLIEIYDKIRKCFENREYTCMIFCDVSKAFDRVWHDGLIHKLQAYGFKNKIADWLKSYLSNRKQRVVVNSRCSPYLPVRAGVPQGSVLGPLLFLIYINDIVDNLRCHARLFAVDSSLISSHLNLDYIEVEISMDLSSLDQWAKLWLVTFNPSKTDVMLLQTTFTMNILRYYLVNLFFLLQTYTNILVSPYNRRENGMYILMK